MNLDRANYSLASAIWEVGAAKANIIRHSRGRTKRLHDYVGKEYCSKCYRTEKRYVDAVANLIIQMILIGRK